MGTITEMVVVKQISPDDERIAKFRSDFENEFGVALAERLAAEWIGAFVGGELCAVAGMTPYADGVYITDFYAVPGRRGVLAIYRIGDAIESIKSNIYATIVPHNIKMRQALLQRGGWCEAAVLVARPYKGVS